MADMAILANIMSIFPYIEHGVKVEVESGSWHRSRSKSQSFLESLYIGSDWSITPGYTLDRPCKVGGACGPCKCERKLSYCKTKNSFNHTLVLEQCIL